MTALPDFASETITPLRVLIDETLTKQAEDVTLDSGNTDSGNTPTWRFREANVIVLRTSTLRYVEANDTNGDRDSAPAAIASSSHTDGNGVIEIIGNHGTISVTTTTGTGTEAENVIDLNADAAFFAHYVATSGGGELTITARAVGGNEWFYMGANTMATASFSEGIANGVRGAWADYRVTKNHADLEKPAGTAVNASASTYWTGHFDESELINLTDEAAAAFLRRGGRFG